MFKGAIGIGTINVSTASALNTPGLLDHQYYFCVKPCRFGIGKRWYVARLLLIEHRQAVDRRDSYVQHTQIDANFPMMMDEIIDNAIT